MAPFTRKLQYASAAQEVRSPFLWPFTASGPANLPRQSGAVQDPLSHEGTKALRGGGTVSCAGTTKSRSTAWNINCAQWSVGVNVATMNDPVWQLPDQNGTGPTLTARIPATPARSAETGNGDYLTELIQPSGISYTIYKFGYATYDVPGCVASYRSDSNSYIDTRLDSGYNENNTGGATYYHRGPRASQVSAMFGLVRRWELARAQTNPQTAIRHVIGVALQGSQIKRGSMNGGVKNVWPAWGSDYVGDAADQVLTPPASGSYTLSSGASTATLAYNATAPDVQAAVRAWGGDHAACTVTSSGATLTLRTWRSAANTITTSAGSITTPGTLYANEGMVMGGYFVLDASVNVESLGLSTPYGKAIAYALQRYGGHVIDTSSTMAMYAEVSAQDIITPVQVAVGADLALLRPYLFSVSNSTQVASHGGGTPLWPLAPPFTPAETVSYEFAAGDVQPDTGLVGAGVIRPWPTKQAATIAQCVPDGDGVIRDYVISQQNPNIAGLQFENCHFRGPATWSASAYCIYNNNPANPGVVRWCTIDPQTPHVYANGIGVCGVEADYCDIKNVVDGGRAYAVDATGVANMTFRRSWLHDFALWLVDPDQSNGPTHNDGIQNQGADDAVIVDGCRIDAVYGTKGDTVGAGPYSLCTLMLSPSTGGFRTGRGQSFTITGSWLSGGNNTVNGGSGSSNSVITASNVVFDLPGTQYSWHTKSFVLDSAISRANINTATIRYTDGSLCPVVNG